MDNKKIGDTIQTLPVDPNQEYPPLEMNYIDEYVKKNKKKKEILEKELYESDEESEDESEEEETSNRPSVWTELKSTFLASLVYVVLSLDIISTSLKSLGFDGLKLSIVKFFLFASVYFILRYKLL